MTRKYAGIYEASLSEENVALMKEDPSLNVPNLSIGQSRLKAPLFDLERGEKVMDGAVDIHIHPAPDPYQRRLGDMLELAMEACQAGMAAAVFKCHHFPTSPMVAMVQRVINQWAGEHGKQSLDVFGGVVLNYAVGGLNPEAVIASSRIGGKVVWPPNVDSRHQRKLEGLEGGIDLLDENDNPLPLMKEILSLMAEGDQVLAMSAISTKERFILIDEAKKMGIKRMEVVHPNQPNSKMTIAQMKIAAEKGAYIGLYCHAFDYPQFSWDEFMDAYKVVGADHIVIGTDQGNFRGFRPVAAMRHFITQMLHRGILDTDVEKMVKTNARNLLY